MSIQWADDFSRYGTGGASRTAMLEGLPYSNIGSGIQGRGEVVADPDPNESGRAFMLPPGTSGVWQNQFRIALPTVISATGRIACRLWQANLPNDNFERPTISFLRGDNALVAYMLIEQNGSITVRGRVAGVDSQVADSVNPIVSPASWNHFEFGHNRATGAGSVRVNGVERLTWTGVDTADNLEFASITAVSGNTLGPLVYVKDLVISDSVGTVNNGVNGTVIVRRLSPSADNTLGGWTPSTGVTGFPLLDKDAPNDATYMSGDDTPPAPMAFALDNLPPDITSVRALLSVVRMRKIDGGDATVENSLSPNGTNWDTGADRPITSAFSYYFDVSELDPATSTAWSPTAVDSALLRIDRTT
jgi:hypothetical protein